jgi:hypothetical protein
MSGQWAGILDREKLSVQFRLLLDNQTSAIGTQ